MARRWRCVTGAPTCPLLTPSPATTNTNTKYKQDTNTNMNTNTNRECKLKSSLSAAKAWLGETRMVGVSSYQPDTRTISKYEVCRRPH